LRTDYEARLQQAIAGEAARREEEIKRLKVSAQALSLTDGLTIGVSSLAFLLSVWTWWEGRRRAKEDRADAFAERHQELSRAISEAKGFLQTGTTRPESKEYAQIVDVGNFFERVASAWDRDHAAKAMLEEHFRADMKDFWERATVASLSETNQWVALKKMVGSI
jgi:hypothetical protein